ncbi:hypothetical protein CC2G_008441 [Coprinopsis cinerea AmutBmut pab1-1]|nr:hypothetical protein CC2G_008441 [Coprinopsis cinerea AmutBmut pab1-1]
MARPQPQLHRAFNVQCIHPSTSKPDRNTTARYTTSGGGLLRSSLAPLSGSSLWLLAIPFDLSLIFLMSTHLRHPEDQPNSPFKRLAKLKRRTMVESGWVWETSITHNGLGGLESRRRCSPVVALGQGWRSIGAIEVESPISSNFRIAVGGDEGHGVLILRDGDFDRRDSEGFGRAWVQPEELAQERLRWWVVVVNGARADNLPGSGMLLRDAELRRPWTSPIRETDLGGNGRDSARPSQSAGGFECVATPTGVSRVSTGGGSFAAGKAETGYNGSTFEFRSLHWVPLLRDQEPPRCSVETKRTGHGEC